MNIFMLIFYFQQRVNTGVQLFLAVTNHQCLNRMAETSQKPKEPK